MKWEVELEMVDVYGGDGNNRYEPREKVSLTRTRTKTTIRQSLGVAVQDDIEDQIKEKKVEPIATFRFDDNEIPMLRLGGAHGKLWGALKACARQLYDLGDPDFKSYKAAVDMINITPVWVPLVMDGDMRVEGIPQIMKGPRGGMIVQYFDVIPRANAKVTLVFPDPLETKMKKMLDHIEIGTHLNKRRATIKVLKTAKAT